MNASVPLSPERAAFADALCDFVNRELPTLHSRIASSPGIGPDTPLFATGILDSLAVLHVVAWVENAIGRPLALEEVVMDRFRDARTIANSFGPSAPAEKSPETPSHAR